jgi:hypothetical protein
MPLSVEPISDLIKVVGLVAGGLWAAWTFHKLQKVRAAELDNNTKLAAIQKSSIEQEELETRLLRQQPQLDIELNVDEKGPVTGTSKSSLCITVTLKNDGEQNLEVEFSPGALTVARVLFDNEGMRASEVHRFKPFYFAVLSDVDSPISDEPQFMSERILRVGQKRKMAIAAIPVQVPGAYMMQFHAVYRRVPFDGEPPFVEAAVQINAIEQTFYVPAGKPATNGNAATRSTRRLQPDASEGSRHV